MMAERQNDVEAQGLGYGQLTEWPSSPRDHRLRHMARQQGLRGYIEFSRHDSCFETLLEDPLVVAFHPGRRNTPHREACTLARLREGTAEVYIRSGDST